MMQRKAQRNTAFLILYMVVLPSNLHSQEQTIFVALHMSNSSCSPFNLHSILRYDNFFNFTLYSGFIYYSSQNPDKSQQDLGQKPEYVEHTGPIKIFSSFLQFVYSGVVVFTDSNAKHVSEGIKRMTRRHGHGGENEDKQNLKIIFQSFQ